MKVIALVLSMFVYLSVYSMEYAFSPPAFSDSGSGSVFVYFLPTESGFSSNVNLLAQPFAGSLEAYDALTLTHFKELKMEIKRHEMRDGEIFYEYVGEMQNQKLHWYARAIKRGAIIYLITATYPQNRVDSDGLKLNVAVDSFDFKE